MIARALLVAATLVATRMPSVDAAFVRHGPAIVGVRAGPEDAAVSTTGFFLTSAGLLATVMLPAERATVTLADGSVRGARVVARAGSRADAPTRDGALTLLEIERAQQDEVFPALAVRKPSARDGAKGSGGGPARHGPSTHGPAKTPAWWLALTFTDGRALPALGGVRRAEGQGRVRLDLPAGPGAPVLIDDEVVAVVVQRVDQTSSVAVDVSALLELAQQLAPARTAQEPPAPR